MLGSMRKFVDKYQKMLLVALAAFLMVVFVIPMGQLHDRGPSPVLGTLYGKEITYEEVEAFARRWQQLGLSFLPIGRSEDYPLHTYLMLRAAEHHGIRVGSGAVDAMLAHDPPQRQKIEYILADPVRLAAKLEPTDAELKTFYESEWTDRSKPFDEVKDDVEHEYRNRRAREAAPQRIREAARLLAAAPRSGAAWETALADVAAQLGLEYDESRFFSEPDARERPIAVGLSPLTESRVRPGRREAEPALPEDLLQFLSDTRTPIGQPSRVFRADDKYFIVRIIETRAGFTPDGTLIPEDWGWRHEQCVMLQRYPDHAAVVKAMRRMDVSAVRLAFEEHLKIQKFLQLYCGGDGVAPLSSDARRQLILRHREQLQALAAEYHVSPFHSTEPPDKKALLDFYNLRKGPERLDHPSRPDFGYYQPERVQLEYVLADTARGRDAAEAALRELRDTRSQRKTGEWLPLERPARQAGLTYRLSPLFARHEAEIHVPELVRAPGFLDKAFDRTMRPRTVPIDRQGTQRVPIRPASPTYESGDKLFFFRVVRYEPPQSIEFTALDPAKREQVERDFAWKRAVDAAIARARTLRAAIAREWLRTVAKENGLSIERAIDGPGGDAEGASRPPAALASHLAATLRRAPGEILLLLHIPPEPASPDADACYTAVVTQVDAVPDNAHVEYIRFKPAQFTAELAPAEDAIKARAEKLRDDELKKSADKPGESKPPAGGEEKPSPTAEQIALAKAQLIEEWKQKPFESRYTEYLARRMTETFRSYVAAHPIELDRAVPLQMTTTSDFFHADDAYPLGGDPALVAAAFQLQPNTLSGAVVGEHGAALLLLAADQSRTDERKFEMVTVRSEDYDPLDVIVTEDEARAYYGAHKEEFRVPARSQAEFIFAPFTGIAEQLEATIPDREIEDYYAQNREGTYRGQPLDARLRDTIRNRLALKEAEARGARAAIEAAIALAKETTAPLRDVAAQLAPKWKLVSGVTPLLGPDDNTIETVGRAASLADAIRAADKGALTDAVQTEDGWAFARVTEKTEASLPEFDAILDLVRSKAREARFAERAASALRKVRAELEKDKTASIAKLLDRPDLAADLPLQCDVATSGYVDEARAMDVLHMTDALRKAIFQTPAGAATEVVITNEGSQLARVIDVKTNRVIKVHYVLVRAEDYIPLVTVSDEDARKYYEANPGKYERPRRCEIEYLLAAPWSLEPDVKPTDAELQTAYEQLKHQFRDNAASTAGVPAYKPLTDENVRRRITRMVQTHRATALARELAEKAAAAVRSDGAKTFKEIAAEHKDLRHRTAVEVVPGSAENPWELRGVPGLDAFLETAEPGATSGILRSRDGLLLVRVTAVHPKSVPPFDEVKEKVRADAARPAALARAKEMIEKVAAAVAEPTEAALSAAASQFTIETKRRVPANIEETPPLSRQFLDAYYQQAARFQPSLLPQLESQYRLFTRLDPLRPGEISEPIVDGEKARTCLLAVLTKREAPELGPEDIASPALAQGVFLERLDALFQAVYAEYSRSAPLQ